MHHILKIKEEFMAAKIAGDKPFEIRINDRGFQKGDTVTYTTDCPPTRDYAELYVITYVATYAQKENWVVFGDRLIGEE